MKQIRPYLLYKIVHGLKDNTINPLENIHSLEDTWSIRDLVEDITGIWHSCPADEARPGQSIWCIYHDMHETGER